MNSAFFLGFADAANFAATNTPLYLTPIIIAVVIVLIGITIFLAFFLKKIITNSIIGAIIWFLAVFVFKVQLPLIPSFVISVIFGAAGIGTMLLLSALGLLV